VEPAAYRVHHDVCAQQQPVSRIAQEREPAGVEHDAVECVTMGDQQLAAIDGFMNRFQNQLDAAEGHAGIVAQHLVMVARDEHHAGAAMRHLEDAAHDFVVLIGPVPALAQPPPVNDVANQVERLAFDRAQEIDEHRRVAAARAEVNVGNPHGAILALGTKTLGVRNIEPRRDSRARGSEAVDRASPDCGAGVFGKCAAFVELHARETLLFPRMSLSLPRFASVTLRGQFDDTCDVALA